MQLFHTGKAFVMMFASGVPYVKKMSSGESSSHLKSIFVPSLIALVHYAMKYPEAVPVLLPSKSKDCMVFRYWKFFTAHFKLQVDLQVVKALWGNTARWGC